MKICVGVCVCAWNKRNNTMAWHMFEVRQWWMAGCASKKEFEKEWSGSIGQVEGVAKRGQMLFKTTLVGNGAWAHGGVMIMRAARCG